MCGRFTLAATIDQILARYGLKAAIDLDWKPRFNIAPTQFVPVIFNEAGERRIQAMKWGLVPSWTRELKGDGLINAKSETAAVKPSFRTAFKKRRCLVPADGFYEWQKPPGGKGAKTPFRIRCRDQGIFSMAGLWETWNEPEGQELRTIAILTTEPNALMKPIHDRMPVILSAENETQWISEGSDPSSLQALLAPYATELLEAYQVGREVNSPMNDAPGCIEPVG